MRGEARVSSFGGGGGGNWVEREGGWSNLRFWERGKNSEFRVFKGENRVRVREKRGARCRSEKEGVERKKKQQYLGLIKKSWA